MGGHWFGHWVRLMGKEEKGSVTRDRSPQCSGPEGWIKVLTGVLELTEEARGSTWQNFGVAGTPLLEHHSFAWKNHFQDGAQSPTH